MAFVGSFDNIVLRDFIGLCFSASYMEKLEFLLFRFFFCFFCFDRNYYHNFFRRRVLVSMSVNGYCDYFFWLIGTPSQYNKFQKCIHNIFKYKFLRINPTPNNNIFNQEAYVCFSNTLTITFNKTSLKLNFMGIPEYCLQPWTKYCRKTHKIKKYRLFY